MQLRRRKLNRKDRGDTLVEVLFATATAGLLIVITLVLMNRNLAQIQMSVETTFVRQAIDSQSEVLRYMRDQYMNNRTVEFNNPPTNTQPTVSKLWKDLVDSTRPGNHAQTAATDFGTCQPNGAGTISSPASGKAFFINSSISGDAEGDAVNIQTLDATNATNLLNTSLGLSNTYARPGQGLWIEAVNPVFSPAQTDRYVDFHIRACWDPPFAASKATLGTIVRLYYVTPGASPPAAFLSICSNGIDDDLDGLTDFPTDPGCVSANDNSEANPPPPPPAIPPINIVWSHTGDIPGKFCVQVKEPVEAGTPDWNDNYLCSDTDYDLQWQVSFTVPAPDGTPYGGTGLRCTYFDNDNLLSNGAREGASNTVGGHAWDDNYLCSATPIELEFRHSLNPAKDCIIINEPSEALTWPLVAGGGNNPAYLCFRKGSP